MEWLQLLMQWYLGSWAQSSPWFWLQTEQDENWIRFSHPINIEFDSVLIQRGLQPESWKESNSGSKVPHCTFLLVVPINKLMAEASPSLLADSLDELSIFYESCIALHMMGNANVKISLLSSGFASKKAGGINGDAAFCFVLAFNFLFQPQSNTR